jgi:hypothetical protein
MGFNTIEFKCLVTGVPLPNVRLLCMVEAALQDLISAVETKHGSQGKYWRLDWKLVVKLGGTRLRACIRWNDRVTMLLYTK